MKRDTKLELGLFIAVSLISAHQLNAQTLRVQVLNGRTREPVAHEHVNLFHEGSFGDFAGKKDVGGFETDANGYFDDAQIAQGITPIPYLLLIGIGHAPRASPNSHWPKSSTQVW